MAWFDALERGVFPKPMSFSVERENHWKRQHLSCFLLYFSLPSLSLSFSLREYGGDGMEDAIPAGDDRCTVGNARCSAKMGERGNDEAVSEHFGVLLPMPDAVGRRGSAWRTRGKQNDSVRATPRWLPSKAASEHRRSVVHVVLVCLRAFSCGWFLGRFERYDVSRFAGGIESKKTQRCFA